MSAKENRYYIEKMIDNLNYIIDHMKGVSKEEFNKNEILQDSMVFRIIQVAERESHLTEDFKEKHADIEWSQIFGMRDRLVHDYGNVDYSIVYETISADIPQLRRRLEDI